MSLDFITKLSQLRFSFISDNLRKGSAVEINSLTHAAKAFVIAGVFKEYSQNTVVICKSESEADYIYSELSLYGIDRDSLHYYPFSASYNYGDTGPDYTGISERIATLYSLVTNNSPKIIIAPCNSLVQKTIPKDNLMKSVITVNEKESTELDIIIEKISGLGYKYSEVCDHHGVFSRRGGILDIYPSGEMFPVRIVFDWGEISEIKYFDTESQRSIKNIKSINILPNREVIFSDINLNVLNKFEEDFHDISKSKATDLGIKIRNASNEILEQIKNKTYFDQLECFSSYVYNETTILDYIPKGTLMFIDDGIYFESILSNLEEKVTTKLLAKEKQGFPVNVDLAIHADYKAILKRISDDFPTLSFNESAREISWINVSKKLELPSETTSYIGKLEILTDEIKALKDFTIVFSTAQESRMNEILRNYNINVSDMANPSKSGVYITKAPLEKGFIFKESKLWVIADGDMFGTRRIQKIRKLSKDSQSVSSYLDMSPGDIVVHVDNGIAIYRGTHSQEVLGVIREFLVLEFQGGAQMYVPTDQVKYIQKYIGGDGNSPVLSKLGSSNWQKAKTKAKKKAEEVARELVELYAWRESIDGFAYSKDTQWQSEMEEAFPYDETESQMKAIEDVKTDLEKDKPMDRLVCGDVGYGKTEVAIRAAFKVTCDRKQVALLAPTTVLAQQHYLSFTERLMSFPTKIALLSRFQTLKEIKKTIELIKSGEADIIIGTHRILSKDVEFKNLGLLIIDEEQRFGVKHKEKLKHLRKNVDVLTLSATPIPRTLHMSLSGIRGLSIINDPPEGRMSIKTSIKESDDNLIADAIKFEIDRNGQVFFIHNRVESIDKMADKIETLVPNARVDIAHGQMSESELESVMLDFYHGDLDVLVATTIIENGLDVPNANTIIINHADKLGLAQLYQLRGRVGRSNRQAYAYFLYNNEYTLSEAADRRLAAIKEFSDLGSGFRIAMKDLEIRGAGNLLGNSQSGCVEEVGFDLYCQFLEHAITELKGEVVAEIDLPTVDMPVDAYIPSSYMPIDAHRILIYKKLASVVTYSELKDIESEVIDRFGAPPISVWNMFSIVEIRLMAMEIGVKNIAKVANKFQVVFDSIKLPDNLIKRMNSQFPNYTFAYDRVFFTSSVKDCIEDTNQILKILPLVFKKANEYNKYL